MTDTISEQTPLVGEGSTEPLTETPVVGTPSRNYPSTFVPGAEELAADEIRVTILGSGDPFVRPSQASASILIEVGNLERDIFFFDLGSGALKNFDGLRLPVTATTKVFLTHLHADHVGDMPTLLRVASGQWLQARGLNDALGQPIDLKAIPTWGREVE